MWYIYHFYITQKKKTDKETVFGVMARSESTITFLVIVYYHLCLHERASQSDVVSDKGILELMTLAFLVGLPTDL